MNKLFLACVMALAIFTGCSKTPNKTINPEDYVFDSTRIQKTERGEYKEGYYTKLHYDENDVLLKEEVFFDYFSNILSSETFYFYNEDGSYTKLINNNPERDTQNLVYEFYDVNGVMYEYYICVFHRPMTYIPTVYGVNEYDKAGNLKQVTEYNVNGTNFEEIYKSLYSYDSENRLDTQKAYYNDELAWEDSYTYKPDKIKRRKYTDGKITQTSIRPAFHNMPVEKIPNFPEEFIFDDSVIANFTINGTLKNYYDRQGRTVKRERDSVEDGSFYSAEYYIYNDDGSYTEKTILTEKGDRIKFTLFDREGLSYAELEYSLEPRYIDGIHVKRWVLNKFTVKVLNEAGQHLEISNYNEKGDIIQKEVWEYNEHGQDTYYAKYGLSGKLKEEKITRWYDREKGYGAETETKILYHDRNTKSKTVSYFRQEVKGYTGSIFLVSKKEHYSNDVKTSESIYNYGRSGNAVESVTVNQYDKDGNITNTYERQK